MKDFSASGLIRYFEMAYKVMGWTNPEESSYEYHAAKMIRRLLEERDEARREVCRLEANIYNKPEDEDCVPLSPKDVAYLFHKWDCFDCNNPMCTQHPECAAQADNQGLSDEEK